MIESQLNQLDDRKLVEGFLNSRDEGTFRELYRRHTPRLYLLALRLVGGAESDAQDLIQETWVRACGKLSGFRWDSALRTWLSGILINCTRELERKTNKRNEEGLSELSGVKPFRDPGHFLELETIIEDLPTGYRQVLILHDIEGYTHEEISRLLDINPGTSKSQLFHARRSVRKTLEVVGERI